MVGHQTVGMHLPAGLLTRFGQGLEEILPAHVIQEYLLPAAASGHDMVYGAGVLKTELARHGRSLPKRGCVSNPRMNQSMADPFL